MNADPESSQGESTRVHRSVEFIGQNQNTEKLMTPHLSTNNPQNYLILFTAHFLPSNNGIPDEFVKKDRKHHRCARFRLPMPTIGALRVSASFAIRFRHSLTLKTL
jgi:hypothetical protein